MRKDLRRFQPLLLVNFSRGQLISRMLEVNKDGVIFALSSNVLDNALALQSGEVNIIAEAQGTKVEFGLAELQHINFDDLPAFSALLPPMLWQIGSIVKTISEDIPDTRFDRAYFLSFDES